MDAILVLRDDGQWWHGQIQRRLPVWDVQRRKYHTGLYTCGPRLPARLKHVRMDLVFYLIKCALPYSSACILMARWI